MQKTLHYQLHGRSDEENAPTVTLIHGLFGSADNLSVIRRALENDFKVLNIDLPDHGKSPRSSQFSFKDYASLVAATLVSLNIKKTDIVAHSLGGKVAMMLAYMQPQLLDRLIILDIAPVSYDARHEDVLKGLNAVDLNAISSRKDAQSMMSAHITEPGIQAFLLKSLYEEDGQWRWRFNLELLERDYHKLSQWELQNEKVYDGDVLFIKGKNSDYINAQQQSTIMRQFPHAKAKIVDAGHWLHAEKPQLVNTIITKHLRGD